MNNRGISPLGLCHPKYNAAKLFRCFDNAAVVQACYLDNFFNPSSAKHAQQLFALPKPKVIEVHIINGPGMNNSRTQPHEISYKENTKSLNKKILQGDARFLKKFDARVRAVRSISQGSGSLELLISPWLEHQSIDKRAFDILANHILQIIPEARIVDNPLNGNGFQGYALERHGANPPTNADIVDLDGTDFESLDMVAYGQKYAHCKMIRIWGVKDNGMDKRDTSWKKPQDRIHWTGSREFSVYRYWTGPNAIEETSALDSQDTTGLRMHDSTDGWKKDFVFKLGDGRNYSVCLLPRSFNGKQIRKVTIRKNGKVIDTGKFRGKYTEDGTNRQIWDFKKHPTRLIDNCVLTADKNGWVLKKPQFRVD